jgi:hypothetical protein
MDRTVDVVRTRTAATRAPLVACFFAKPKVWKGWQGLPMAKVKYITSPDEIPVGQNYVLVTYGKEYTQMRHPLGLTISVARQESKSVSELSFLTAVRTAKGIAKQEGISNIFAYTSSDLLAV